MSLNADATTHRGWTVEENFLGIWEGTGPDFDASYEGEEDGWVGNGQAVFADTREICIQLIDDWIEEHSA